MFEYYKGILIEKYGYDEQFFTKELKQWLEKFGNTEKSRLDFIWSVFNRLTTAAARNCKNEYEMLSKLRPIYVGMWEFLVKEGRDSTHVHRLFLECDLRMAFDETYKVNAMVIATGCCTECEKIDGIVIPLEEALERQLLPNKECTRSTGCYCCYGFHAERDLEGNLVKK